MQGPITFHSRGEVPYGVLSNFSPHPIWIGLRRYRTVEHWYQAMKAANDSDHERIRNSESPEEAKQRGSEVRLREDWPDERAAVMLRGVLAKFRQHPELGELLLGTSHRDLHEASDDPIWGARGEDGLGRTLMVVRDLLRDPFSVDLSAFDRRIGNTVLARYFMAATIRELREHGGGWLVHLIREMGDEAPERRLASILSERTLRASTLLNGHDAVCFTASPLAVIEDRVFGEEATLRRRAGAYAYSPFGIAIRYDYARERGCMPVLPIAPHLNGALPESLRFLANPHGSAICFDYTHEEEWRHSGDFDVHEGPVAVVLPATTGHGLRVIELWRQSFNDLLEELRERTPPPAAPSQNPVQRGST